MRAFLLVWLLGLAAAAAAVSGAEHAGRGYLPAVGPPPLRFAQPPPPTPVVPIVLPPLEPAPGAVLTPDGPDAGTHVNPGARSVAVSSGPEAGATPRGTRTPGSGTRLWPATNANPMVGFGTDDPLPPLSAVVPLDGSELLTPQLFMKYFSARPGTNTTGNGITVFTPVTFVPPQPILPPSSSATFETTPAGKP